MTIKSIDNEIARYKNLLRISKNARREYPKETEQNIKSNEKIIDYYNLRIRQLRKQKIQIRGGSLWI